MCILSLQRMQHSDLLLQYPDETVEIKSLKMPETLENIRMQHARIVIATYAASHIYFCNIQTKHLKPKSGTPETRRHWWPQPTWWGTAVASKFGAGGRRPVAPPTILPCLLAT